MSDLEARLRDFEEIVHSADKSRTGDLIEWLEERSDGHSKHHTSYPGKHLARITDNRGTLGNRKFEDPQGTAGYEISEVTRQEHVTGIAGGIDSRHPVHVITVIDAVLGDRAQRSKQRDTEERTGRGSLRQGL